MMAIKPSDPPIKASTLRPSSEATGTASKEALSQRLELLESRLARVWATRVLEPERIARAAAQFRNHEFLYLQSREWAPRRMQKFDEDLVTEIIRLSAPPGRRTAALKWMREEERLRVIDPDGAQLEAELASAARAAIQLDTKRTAPGCGLFPRLILVSSDMLSWLTEVFAQDDAEASHHSAARAPSHEQATSPRMTPDRVVVVEGKRTDRHDISVIEAEDGGSTSQTKNEHAPPQVPSPMDRARAWRDKLLREGGFLTSHDVAKHARGEPLESNPSQYASRLRREGRLLGARFRGKTYHPPFQFSPLGEPHPKMKNLLALLPDDDTGWPQVFWCYQPTLRLDGARPADVFPYNPDAVIHAAEKEFRDRDNW